MASMNAKGRPLRTDRPQRMTLHLALSTKLKLFRLASQQRRSMSQIVDALIEEIAEEKEEQP
jgi:hypothetical protein